MRYLPVNTFSSEIRQKMRAVELEKETFSSHQKETFRVKEPGYENISQ